MKLITFVNKVRKIQNLKVKFVLKRKHAMNVLKLYFLKLKIFLGHQKFVKVCNISFHRGP